MSKFKDIRREMKERLAEYEEKIAEFGEHAPEISAGIMKQSQEQLTTLIDEMESHFKAWQHDLAKSNLGEAALGKAQEQLKAWGARLTELKGELHTSSEEQVAWLRSLEERTREKLRALKSAKDSEVVQLTTEAVHALDDLKHAIEHVLPQE